MKLHQALVFVAAFSSVTETSFGQSVSTEKKGYQALNPDIYGSLEVRYAVLRSQAGGAVTNDAPAINLMPTLGVNLFDSAVTSAFTFIYSKTPGSMVVGKSGLFNETMWTAVKGQYGAIAPYAYSEFNPDGNAFQFANVGADFSTRKKFENDLGSLSLSGYVQPKVQVVSSRTSKTEGFTVTPRNETSRPNLAFGEEGTKEVEQRDPTIIDDLGGAISVSPARLKDLSTGFSVDITSQWRPKYVTREVNGDLTTDFDAYERRSLTFTRWNVGYKVSDRVKLSGFVGYNMGGLYEYNIQNDLARVNHELSSARWNTRVSVTSVLF